MMKRSYPIVFKLSSPYILTGCSDIRLKLERFEFFLHQNLQDSIDLTEIAKMHFSQQSDSQFFQGKKLSMRCTVWMSDDVNVRES